MGKIQDKPEVIEGRKTEVRFANLYENPIFSTVEQDRHEHWDLEITFKGDRKKVDVKGIKKISRKDDETNEMFHYVELRNVNGDKGWLYGKADLFVFETESYWVIVEAEKLRDFVAKVVNKEKVNRVQDCLYKFYQRKGKKDLITMVKTLDLMFLASEIKSK